MNGRIYDASIGRFLQADPNIDGVTKVGGFNRYSYGKNNPLNGIDPSGYGFLSDLWDDIKVVVAVVVLVVAVVVTYGAASYWAMSAYCAAGCGLTAVNVVGAIAGGAAAGFVAGTSIAAYNGATPREALKAGAKGALTGAISGGFGAWAGSIGAGSIGGAASKLAVSAAGGCLSGLASGGNCDDGAKKAALAAVLSMSIEKLAEHTPTYKTPENGRAVYKMDDKSITRTVCPECDVPNELVNNIGSATKVGADKADLIGKYVPDSELGLISEGGLGSRMLSKIPGFNSGGVVHDRFVGTVERATGISKLTGWQRGAASLFTNQATIAPVIGANYYALGAGSLDYYAKNLISEHSEEYEKN